MRKNYFLTLFLAAVFGLYSCSDTTLDEVDQHVADIQEEQAEVVPGEDPESDADYMWQAMQQMDRLNAAFGEVPLGPGNVTLPYPGYYGGAYINDDGKLVVYIKGNSDKLKQKIYDIVGSDDVVIRRAQHNYGSLNRIMKGLNDFKMNPANAAASANWKAFALMDADNEVLVQLDQLDDKSIKDFKKNVMNHPAIRFVQRQGDAVEEATLNPGCRVSDGSYVGSYAFRARDQYGDEGMVSSGHLFTYYGEPAYDSGTQIGSCTATQNSGSVDAAFVLVIDPSTYIPSNYICGTSDYLSTSTSRPGSGTVVNKRSQTTGRTTGKIISTNASETFSGKFFTNLTNADYASSGGDSGGVVYTYVSSTNTRYTVGVHKGTGSDGYKYFTKADLALSALNVSRY